MKADVIEQSELDKNADKVNSKELNEKIGVKIGMINRTFRRLTCIMIVQVIVGHIIIVDKWIRVRINSLM